MANGFSTIKRARTIGLRHSGVPSSVKAIAMYLASYADGKTGTCIYPGEDAICADLDYNRRTVSRAIEWLIAHGELRRDNRGRSGSRAQYSYMGVHLRPSEALPPHCDANPARPTGSNSEAEVPRPPTHRDGRQAVWPDGQPEADGQGGFEGCAAHREYDPSCVNCRDTWGIAPEPNPQEEHGD